mmetsp:Transcript_65605/g.131725  ORF Transcript_65605/g.131725 Transcript_65605/m.131725 type:complete len:201 (+) Transcript_65605:149-751(+)
METPSNCRDSPDLKVGGLGPCLAASISSVSTSGRVSSPPMSLLTREAKPLSLPTRVVRAKRLWMAEAMASMFRHVEEKYCASWSLEYCKASSPPPPPRRRSGRARRKRPMTVTKYLFKYCRTTSASKDRSIIFRQCARSWSNCRSSTRFSGRSPPRKAICSQFAMSSECLLRNLPSSCCSAATSSPIGGSMKADTEEGAT